ncbi:MAG TPA: hypothetical protein VE782_10820 [Myxococcaceae bacterium]|nr:hypothetical protein [Myxococcaceae bacterium]
MPEQKPAGVIRPSLGHSADLGLARALLVLFAFSTPPAAGAEVNGYLSSRSQFTRAPPGGLVSTEDLPQAAELLELNGQVRQAFLGRALVYGDVSLFGQVAWDYRGVDGDGREVKLPDRDAPAARPLVSVNELYLGYEFRPELNLLAGKKRVVWGPGMAFNPTDLLNPPKDPTDPSLQRAGAWLAMVEVPLERLTFSVLASPKVTAQASGIPYRFVYWPRWDEQDTRAHYLFAGRMYALVENADVNLMLFYGNEYPDAFRKKIRSGASFSRYFGDVNELHFEALFQSGSPRSRANGACVADPESAMRCALAQTPFTLPPPLDSAEFLPRILLGGRHHFGDESILSLEYLFQADGYSRREVQDLVSALSLLRQARGLGLPVPALVDTASAEGGIPIRFRFEPIGQNYLFATFQKPRIRDDFTFAVTALASLQDLSGLVAPSLSWSAKEWLTLTASAFVPFPGPSSLAARDPQSGEAISEYGLAPLAWRGLLEVKVFY